MLGFNGGLLGVRRTPTLGAATGLWFPNEQSVAKRDSIWPIPVGSISDYSPILWYDFADESKVAISGSQITSVTDQGSLGLNLTKSSIGPAYTTAINGKKCVDWGAQGHANYLRNTTSISSIGEIYIVLSTSGVTNFTNFNGLVSSTLDSAGQFYLNGLGSDWLSSVIDEVFVNGSASPTSSTAGIGSPALVRVKKSDNSSFASTGFQIGQDRVYDFLGRGWPGFIGEVVVFASPLGTIQRTNVQTILATKWGLTLS